jgi:hypothetical protein
MEKQMEALMMNDTWELVDLNSLPSGAKILLRKWVYIEKEQKNSEKIQKARWVV